MLLLLTFCSMCAFVALVVIADAKEALLGVLLLPLLVLSSVAVVVAVEVRYALFHFHCRAFAAARSFVHTCGDLERVGEFAVAAAAAAFHAFQRRGAKYVDGGCCY